MQSKAFRDEERTETEVYGEVAQKVPQRERRRMKANDGRENTYKRDSFVLMTGKQRGSIKQWCYRITLSVAKH